MATKTLEQLQADIEGALQRWHDAKDAFNKASEELTEAQRRYYEAEAEAGE